MKFLILTLFVMLVYSCGPNAAEVAEQLRKQDSIEAVKLDSIQNEKRIQELIVKYVYVDSTKNEYQKRFDDVVIRLDSLTGEESEWYGKLTSKMGGILRVKEKIGDILRNQTLTESDKTKIEALLSEMNIKVDALVKSVSKGNKP